jgi:hypothetical protein
VTAVILTQATARQRTLHSGSHRPRHHYPWSLRHANFAPHAIYAHRLWISLWMSLGHLQGNSGQPEGNAKLKGGPPSVIHSLAGSVHGTGTAAVHENPAHDLRGRQISPGSTDPMTTTTYIYSGRSHSKQAASFGRATR